MKSHGSGEFTLEDLGKIGDNTVIEPGVLAFDPENIYIGDNVYIGHCTILRGYRDKGNKIYIDDNTWIGAFCFLHGAGGIKIGKYVGIGPRVTIITSTHKENDINTPLITHELDFKPVIIRDGCDIGISSNILPGTSIDEHTIIGAGSLVKGNIAPWSIYAGIPAEFIRKRKEVEPPNILYTSYTPKNI